MSDKYHLSRGTRRRQAANPLPDDLYDYADDPEPRQNARRLPSPPHVFDVEGLPVIDDWPERVPITEAEVRVFERWFADVFDEMFGPLGSPEGLNKLSPDDNEKP